MTNKEFLRVLTCLLVGTALLVYVKKSDASECKFVEEFESGGTTLCYYRCGPSAEYTTCKELKNEEAD